MRILKAHRWYAEFSEYHRAWEALATLRCSLEALGISTEEFVHYFWGLDELTAEDEFEYGWPMIHQPAGESAIDQALSSAINDPLFPDIDVKGKVNRRHRFFNFVYYLGRLCADSGDGSVFLPVERLAAILQCSESAISIYRALATRNGFITEEEPYSVSSHKATKFSVHLEAMQRAAALRRNQQAN